MLMGAMVLPRPESLGCRKQAEHLWDVAEEEVKVCSTDNARREVQSVPCDVSLL